ncbi:hypothetical protein MAR_018181, partial [Mya arenaria]
MTVQTLPALTLMLCALMPPYCAPVLLVKSTEVSAVLIAVPIASVVVVILAVTTACLIKQRRNRLEANHGN